MSRYISDSHVCEIHAVQGGHAAKTPFVDTSGGSSYHQISPNYRARSVTTKQSKRKGGPSPNCWRSTLCVEKAHSLPSRTR